MTSSQMAAITNVMQCLLLSKPVPILLLTSHNLKKLNSEILQWECIKFSRQGHTAKNIRPKMERYKVIENKWDKCNILKNTEASEIIDFHNLNKLNSEILQWECIIFSRQGHTPKNFKPNMENTKS